MDKMNYLKVLISEAIWAIFDAKDSTDLGHNVPDNKVQVIQSNIFDRMKETILS